MPTKKQIYEQLRKRVYEIIYPNGIPLDRNVELKIRGEILFIERVSNDNFFLSNGKLTSNIEIEYDKGFEILGKPLELQDILRAVGKRQYEYHTSLIMWGNGKGRIFLTDFDLSKPIQEQSEETLKGLLSLIK